MLTADIVNIGNEVIDIFIEKVDALSNAAYTTAEVLNTLPYADSICFFSLNCWDAALALITPVYQSCCLQSIVCTV